MKIGLLVGKSKYHSQDKYRQIMTLIKELNSYEILLVTCRDGLSVAYEISEDYPDLIKGIYDIKDINCLGLSCIFVVDPYSRYEVSYCDFEMPIIYKEYGVAGLEPTTGYLIKSPVYKYAKVIITETEFYKQKIKEIYPDKSVFVGSPAFDFSFKIKPKRNEIKHILWTPHHTIVNKDSYDKICGCAYSNFLRDKNFMINEFMSRLPNDVILHIHPHPNLKIRYNQLRNSRSAYREWVSSISRSPYSDRIVLEEQKDYHELFDECDLIINDSISFLLEWLPTKKPMIVVRSEDSKYSEFGEKLIKDNYSEAFSQDDIVKRTLDYLNGSSRKYPLQSAIDKLFIFSGSENSKILAKVVLNLSFPT